MSRIGGLAVDATPEEWRPVVGWEGSYEVSDYGHVRSLDRVGIGRWGPMQYKGRLLSTKPAASTGYRVCVLVAGGGIRKDCLVHRLVLEAFVGPCPDGMECCHGDGDRSNAKLTNLRWDTRSSNTLDAIAHKTNYQTRKTKCPKGHPYDGVYYSSKKGPSRYCKRCAADRARRGYRLRARAR